MKLRTKSAAISAIKDFRAIVAHPLRSEFSLWSFFSAHARSLAEMIKSRGIVCETTGGPEKERLIETTSQIKSLRKWSPADLCLSIHFLWLLLLWFEKIFSKSFFLAHRPLWQSHLIGFLLALQEGKFYVQDHLVCGTTMQQDRAE